MFGGFFDMDKPFWRWMGKIPDLILLSLCWYICCIPVITIIPASCALFDAVSRNLMMDDKGIYKRYFFRCEVSAGYLQAGGHHHILLKCFYSP